MGNECESCGGEVEWKNNVGHYRDHCKECAQEIADERTLARELEDPPHEVTDEHD